MKRQLPAIYHHKGECIQLLVLDVDGVFTDGALYYDRHGEFIKAFNVLDGLGLKLVRQAGVKLAIISSKGSEALQNRLNALGIEETYLNVTNKIATFDTVVKQHQLKLEQVAYMGDDLPDLPLIKKAGLGIAVANAHDAIKAEADCVTDRCGGHGAIREVCDYLLESKDLLDTIIDAYKTQGEWQRRD